MQVSNRDPGPSSTSSESNTACQKIETILRNIKRRDLLAKFQGSQGFVWDDTLIPYSKDQLPKDKRKYQDQFLGEQKKHLLNTPQQVQAILKPADRGAPPHLHTIDIGKIFDIGEKLGEGTYGMVLKAKWSHSQNGNVDAPSRTFAIKRFPKPLQGRATKKTLKSFKTERDNLECSEKQKHDHLVSFHASFTDEKYFGFITSPVAESNLKSLLEKSIKNHDIGEDENESLSQAFGCLLEAVRHLHDDLSMRHCDLKPSNILVCGRPGSHFSVRICDLGISYAWNFPQDESTDKNQRGTQRYKAPELSSEQDTTHNRMVDIFSLGCIFLEMLTRLSGRTLDQMARAIRQDRESSFDCSWAYAESLSGVKKWLEELQTSAPLVAGEEIVSLIKDMLHEDRQARKKAEELLRMIRSPQKYVGGCCRGELSSQSSQQRSIDFQGPQSSGVGHEAQPELLKSDDEPESSKSDDGPMDYETSMQFKGCTIKSREGLNNYTNSEYKCLKNFPQGGEVVIGKTDGGEAWATTRWVKAFPPSRIEAEQWLPAYYVQARQNGSRVSFKWSNCDQLNQKKGDRQQARRFEKVHLSSPARSNLLMEIDFCNDSDASYFCKLLLEDPFNPKAPDAPDQKSLAIHECKWKCANKDSVANGGKGSLVVCSQHLEQSTRYTWLEPFFVPYDFDFTIPLQNDQRHTQLVTGHLWVPEYRSNVKDRYEEPKDRGVFDNVELVRLRNEYTFNFETAFETDIMPESRHHEPTLGNNRSYSLRDFLESLTGWNLLAVFFATKVLQHHRWSSSSKGSHDVLCFQKGREKRIALRKEYGDDKKKWTTAKLVDPQVDTKTQTLEAQLSSIQRGQFLTLATVRAAAGETQNSSKKSEKWSFTVKHGAADIHNALTRP